MPEIHGVRKLIFVLFMSIFILLLWQSAVTSQSPEHVYYTSFPANTVSVLYL